MARLPSAYQEVEWIGFASGTYINTGIIPTNHSVEVKVNDISYYNDKHWFGTDINDGKYFHFTTYSNAYYWGYNGTETHAGTWTSGIHTLKFNYGSNNEYILDETTLASGTASYGDGSLQIGRRKTVANCSDINFYYFKVYDKTTSAYVRNLIPCYRISDSVIGMYDLVNDVFYTNAGSGTFTKGDDVFYEVTLTYNTEIGTAPSSVTLGDAPQTLTSAHLPTLSYSLGEFCGWYYNSTFTNQASVGDVISTAGITRLYAKWKFANKVQYGNRVLVDLTSDTATADKVLSGYTFHLASGQQAVGTGSGADSIFKTYLRGKGTNWDSLFKGYSNTIYEGDSFTLPFSAVTSASSTFDNTPNSFKCEELILETTSGQGVYANCLFANWGRNGTVKKVTFTNGFKPTYTRLTFQVMARLEEIDGEIDFSANTGGNSFWQGCESLTTVTIKPNSMTAGQAINNGGYGAPPFSDASLISIANGMNEGSAGTQTFTTAQKTNMQTIMGTVALDSTSTYHIFTADASGTVSLSDFITDTKGWTLG